MASSPAIRVPNRQSHVDPSLGLRLGPVRRYEHAAGVGRSANPHLAAYGLDALSTDRYAEIQAPAVLCLGCANGRKRSLTAPVGTPPHWFSTSMRTMLPPGPTLPVLRLWKELQVVAYRPRRAGCILEFVLGCSCPRPRRDLLAGSGADCAFVAANMQLGIGRDCAEAQALRGILTRVAAPSSPCGGSARNSSQCPG